MFAVAEPSHLDTGVTQSHLPTQGFAKQLIDIARAAVARALIETGCHPRRGPRSPAVADPIRESVRPRPRHMVSAGSLAERSYMANTGALGEF